MRSGEPAGDDEASETALARRCRADQGSGRHLPARHGAIHPADHPVETDDDSGIPQLHEPVAAREDTCEGGMDSGARHRPDLDDPGARGCGAGDLGRHPAQPRLSEPRRDGDRAEVGEGRCGERRLDARVQEPSPVEQRARDAEVEHGRRRGLDALPRGDEPRVDESAAVGPARREAQLQLGIRRCDLPRGVEHAPLVLDALARVVVAGVDAQLTPPADGEHRSAQHDERPEGLQLVVGEG